MQAYWEEPAADASSSAIAVACAVKPQNAGTLTRIIHVATGLYVPGCKRLPIAYDCVIFVLVLLLLKLLCCDCVTRNHGHLRVHCGRTAQIFTLGLSGSEYIVHAIFPLLLACNHSKPAKGYSRVHTCGEKLDQLALKLGQCHPGPAPCALLSFSHPTTELL